MEYLIGILALIFLGMLLSRIGIRRRSFAAEMPSSPASAPRIWESPALSRSMQAEERILRIAADARLILSIRYRGGAGSRREMPAYGLSERQWRAAHRLLLSLRICDARSGLPLVAERTAEKRLIAWANTQRMQAASFPNYVLPL